MALIRTQIYDEDVPGASGAQKFRAVSRVVGRTMGRSRWSRATYAAGRSFAATAGNVLRALWHQVTGLFFFVFGAVIALRTISEYRKYAAGQTGAGNVILAGCIAAMFLFFAASAFRRAGRKR